MFRTNRGICFRSKDAFEHSPEGGHVGVCLVNSENGQSCIRLTLTRVATVSVPIVAETCARRGAGFSRFLQLVPGEGESQTTGKLCVLHFLCKGLTKSDLTVYRSTSAKGQKRCIT